MRFADELVDDGAILELRRQTTLSSAGISALIAAVDEPAFEHELVRFLRDACGAEHVHLFRLGGPKPRTFLSASIDGSQAAAQQTAFYFQSQAWRGDLSMADACRNAAARPNLYQVRAESAATREMRNYWRHVGVGERSMVCGPMIGGGVMGLTVLRSGDAPARPDWTRALYDVAFPLFAKHYELRDRADMRHALASLAQIEGNLQRAPEKLTRREIQVAARLLRGMTAKEIAQDLNVGVETVVTQRKKLYQRISIESHRELPRWYLGHIPRMS